MSQGQHRKAEKLFLTCLEDIELRLGKDDVLYWKTMNNLGELYLHQKRWSEAESTLRECAKELRCRNSDDYGPDHPMTLTCLNNLAVAWRGQNRLEDAAILYLEAMPKLREKLGNTHPQTRSIIQNLAGCYALLGQFQQAEALLEEYLAMINDDDPNIHTHWTNMADIYTELGKYDKAECFLRKCLRKCPSISHPDALQYIQRLNDLKTKRIAANHQGVIGVTAVRNQSKKEERNSCLYHFCGIVCLVFVVISFAASVSGGGEE